MIDDARQPTGEKFRNLAFERASRSIGRRAGCRDNGIKGLLFK